MSDTLVCYLAAICYKSHLGRSPTNVAAFAGSGSLWVVFRAAGRTVRDRVDGDRVVHECTV